MMPLTLPPPPRGVGNVLCLGAHSDDIEIGCGGTILRLAAEWGGAVSFTWVVFSGDARRAGEAAAGARLFLEETPCRVFQKSFRDGFFPYQGGEIKECFEALKRECRPELVFTHYREDRHQDHRLLHDLTWNTFRDQLVLEYEIVKYDGDLGRPNLFVPLSGEVCRRKVECLESAFTSQRENHWFNEETFLSLLRLRGVECNSPSGYAEAFHCRKMVL